MDVKELVWEGVNGVHLFEDRDHLEGFCEHINTRLYSVKGGDILTGWYLHTLVCAGRYCFILTYK
jgi:hypothetical protein